MGSSVLDQRGMAPQPGAALLGNVAYIPPGLEGKFKRPFTYNAFFASIAQNATQTVTININNDSFFVCVQATADIWDQATGNTTNTAPNLAAMTVLIADSSSGQNQMDIATPVGALFGTALQPFVWLYRANLFFPGGTMQVTLTNRMAATQRVQLSFSGFKVYRQPDENVAKNYN